MVTRIISQEMQKQIQKAKKKRRHVAIMDMDGVAVVSGVPTSAYSMYPDKGVHMFYVDMVTRSGRHETQDFLVIHPPPVSVYDKAIHDVESALMAAILVSSNDQDRAHSVAKSHAPGIVESIIQATMERIDVQEN